MPSDELCAAVGKTASACWQKMVDLEALQYERNRLASMGVHVPPHTLHDYSLSATRIVIEAIKLHAETMARTWQRRNAITGDGHMGPTAMYHLAPLYGALQVEQGRLARLERRAA
jgi:hypothetical protein